MNHTPGPWKVREDYAAMSVVSYDTFLARVGPRNTEQAVANARLISAAPDLLGALLMVLDDPQALDGRPRTAECVRAAIAKATGGMND